VAMFERERKPFFKLLSVAAALFRCQTSSDNLSFQLIQALKSVARWLEPWFIDRQALGPVLNSLLRSMPEPLRWSPPENEHQGPIETFESLKSFIESTKPKIDSEDGRVKICHLWSSRLKRRLKQRLSVVEPKWDDLLHDAAGLPPTSLLRPEIDQMTIVSWNRVLRHAIGSDSANRWMAAPALEFLKFDRLAARLCKWRDDPSDAAAPSLEEWLQWLDEHVHTASVAIERKVDGRSR